MDKLVTRRAALASLTSCCAAGTLVLPRAAQAAAPWPTAKSVTYVVPFTPGGSTDLIGRTLAAKLTESLGQTVLVENRPGTGGGIGTTYVAGAAPDGYTLLGGTISLAMNASLYKNLPYDPVKSFEPISLVVTVPNVLLVGTNLGVNSVPELIALIRRDDTKRTFASSGIGTSSHLAGELFSEIIGVPLTHVPYKGTSPALIDLSEGRVTMMFDQMTAATSLLQAGKLKLLAVTAATRMAAAPRAPTMIESGVTGFEMGSWQAVFAPKGTPRPIVDRLNADIVKAVQSADVRQKFESLGMEVVGSTPAELATLVSTEIPRWAAVVKRANLALN
jgi:tripartite-type tricarboxylate transporter receptor subunit TctC